MLRTCFGEVANLLWTYYGETGVIDFGVITLQVYGPSWGACLSLVTVTYRLMSVYVSEYVAIR